jgi:hypothetical protein
MLLGLLKCELVYIDTVYTTKRLKLSLRPYSDTCKVPEGAGCANIGASSC